VIVRLLQISEGTLIEERNTIIISQEVSEVLTMATTVETFVSCHQHLSHRINALIQSLQPVFQPVPLSSTELLPGSGESEKPSLSEGKM
jgi:hypothetical protein